MTADGNGEQLGLREFLSAAEPNWKDRDLEAVVNKLARVGVDSLEPLLKLLEKGDLGVTEEGEAEGQAAEASEHEINRLLRACGERRFSAGTLRKLRALAARLAACGGLLRAELRTLAGELLELDFAPHCRGQDLKARAAEHFRVPIACQRAVVGGAVLGDSELLLTHLPPNATVLSVTVVVSLDAVIQDLEEDVGPIRKVTALCLLTQLPSTSTQQALQHVGLHLGHENGDVRRAALRALGRLAPRGDEQAIAWIAGCLEEGVDTDVRQSAVETLGDLAEQGDEAILGFLHTCFEDREATVRMAAAQSLLRVAPEGSEEVADALCALLEDANEGVRAFAIGLLPRLACGACGGRVVAAATGRLEHGDVDVRRCAVLALGSLGVLVAADAACLAALRAKLSDADAPVRCAALEVLSGILGADDLSLANAAHAMLDDPDEAARAAGLVALRRRAAVLGADAPGSPAQTVLSVAKRLQDPSNQVRKAAVETLRVVAEEGNVLAVTQAVACTEHRDPGVQLSAVEVLGSLAERGDKCVVEALLDLLPSAKQHVALRLAIMEALRSLVTPGDARASTAAYECCLEDPSAAVRGAAWAVCERLESG